MPYTFLYCAHHRICSKGLSLKGGWIEISKGGAEGRDDHGVVGNGLSDLG